MPQAPGVGQGPPAGHMGAGREPDFEPRCAAKTDSSVINRPLPQAGHASAERSSALRISRSNRRSQSSQRYS